MSAQLPYFSDVSFDIGLSRLMAVVQGAVSGATNPFLCAFFDWLCWDEFLDSGGGGRSVSVQAWWSWIS